MPNPSALQAKASGVIARWRVSIYSVGLTLIYRQEGEQASPGWNRLPLPRLAAGTYYFELREERGSGRKVGRLIFVP